MSAVGCLFIFHLRRLEQPLLCFGYSYYWSSVKYFRCTAYSIEAFPSSHIILLSQLLLCIIPLLPQHQLLQITSSYPKHTNLLILVYLMFPLTLPYRLQAPYVL
ncbi:hypothetical protein FKM82_031269 [Ascaphus truei]